MKARYSYRACSVMVLPLAPKVTPCQYCLSYLPRFRISKGLQPLMPSRRLRVVWIAKRPRSQPIHRRPSFSATARVVPEPQKKSATKSPGLDDAVMILVKSSSVFCVGYPRDSTAFICKFESRQTLEGVTPP